jgi:hypothetical protein
LKLFVDENLPPVVARSMNILLSVAGHEVVAARDKCPGAADEDWIRSLNREGGWCVLSHDLRIRRDPLSKAAWRSSSLIGFFLAPAFDKRIVTEKVALVLWHWPAIVTQASIVQGPALFELPVNRTSKFRALPL